MASEQEIAKLIIRFTADLKGLKSELNQARNEIKSGFSKADFTGLREGFSGIIALAGKLSAAVGSAYATLRGVESAVSAVVELGKQVAQLQRTTGMTAEEASTLIAVADNLFISFDTIANAVTQITRKMGGLRDIESMTVDSSGKMVDVFEKFDIQVKDSTTGAILPFMSVLGQIRDRIREAESATEQMAIATQFFRNGSQEMLKLLTLSDEEYKKATEDIKKYGLVIGQDTVNQVKAFRDASNDLKDSIQGLKIQIGTELLPVLTEFFQGIATLISQVQELKKEFGSAGSIIGVGLTTILVAFQGLFSGVTSIIVALVDINLVLLQILDVITLGKIPALKQALIDVALLQGKLMDSIQAQSEAINRTLFGKPIEAKAIFDVTGDISSLKKIAVDPKQADAIEKLKKKLEELSIKLQEIQDPAGAAQRSIQLFFDEVVKATGKPATKEMLDLLDKLRAKMTEITEAEDSKKWLDDIGKAMDGFKEKTQALGIDLEKELDPIRAASQEFNFAIYQMIKGIKVVGTDMSGWTWEDVLGHWINDPMLGGFIKNLQEAYKNVQDTQGKFKLIAAEAVRIEMENSEQTAIKLSELDAAYDRGTISLTDYYTKKRTISQQSTSVTIDLLSQELSRVNLWTESREKQTKIIEIETKIRQAVLREQKNGIDLNAEEWRSIQTLMGTQESLIQSYIDRMNVQIEMGRKTFEVSKPEAIQRQIILQNQLLFTYEDQKAELEKIGAVGGTAYEAVLNNIQRTKAGIQDLTLALQEQTGTVQDALTRAWNEWTDSLKSNFEIIRDAAKETFRAVGDSFETFFTDVLGGQVKTARDYLKSFENELNRIIAKMARQQLENLFTGGTTGGGLFAGFKDLLGLTKAVPAPAAPMPTAPWVAKTGGGLETAGITGIAAPEAMEALKGLDTELKSKPIDIGAVTSSFGDMDQTLQAVPEQLGQFTEIMPQIGDDLGGVIDQISEMDVEWSGLITNAGEGFSNMFDDIGSSISDIIGSLSGTDLMDFMDLFTWLQVGGLIRKGSGTRDDVPIMAMRGEFMQPVSTVRYYGEEVMEKLRKREIPREIFFISKEALRSLPRFSDGGPIVPQAAFSSISSVTEVNAARTLSAGPITINHEFDNRISESRFKDAIESAVIRALKEFSR